VAARVELSESLEGLWGASPTLAKYVNEMSDGKVHHRSLAAGEIVPGLQVWMQSRTARSSAAIPTADTTWQEFTLIFDGRFLRDDPAPAECLVLYGDGKKLMDEVYDGMGVVSIPIGNTGGQTFGWFRREMKSPADFNGIKMRVAGFGGRYVEARRGPATDRGR